MNELSHAHCTPCTATSAALTDEELKQLMPLIPGWTTAICNDEMRLEKIFKFSNFIDALAFSNKVGALAEQQDHHPAILTEWGKVTISWWTHSIHGLHRNDFILAAKTDLEYQGYAD